MNNDSDWVVVGRFGRPHGIKGFITIISFTDPRDNILDYTGWHARINHQWQPLKILHHETTNKSILVQVDGYQERNKVGELTNIDLAVKREQLPTLEEGEYYWHQLEGMQVITKQGTVLGIVKEIMPTGANDVLVVVGEKRHLIPYLLDNSIIHIDDNQRIITVDWDVDF